LLIVCAITIYTTACLRGPDEIPPNTALFKTYRDIPGITAQEIAAIEAIKEKHNTFIYGLTLTAEAFLEENSEVGGYSALFCEWLTELFDIRFQPKIYDWNDLLGKINAGEIDFAGNMTLTEERRKIYYMTDPVAERQCKTIQLAGSPSLDRIALIRPLRYVFIEGAAIAAAVASLTDTSTYEAIFVNNYAEAYSVLENGDADAFIGDSAVVLSFDTYGDVQTGDFLPLIFSPVAMATVNAELEPIIRVITKAQRNGAMPYLNNLFNQGYEDYKKHKFISHLNDEEKAYLRDTVSVPLLAQYFNYPIVFYDTHDKIWDGIAIDLLREVEKLTGLAFQVVNGDHTEILDLMAMLSDGRGHIFTDLIKTKEREAYFIWNKNKFMTDQYALLSKIDYPNVNINEIPYKRIALIEGTAYEEMFRFWFPSAVSTTEYSNISEAFFALERGKADLMMAAKTKLLYYVNYFEFSGYKANFLFNSSYESAFFFFIDQTVLCFIIDKSIPFIDSNVIVEQWVTKTYDYKAQLAQAQLPWLIGAIVLSCIILVLMLVIFYRNYKHRKRLIKLIAEVSEANGVKNNTINVMENVLNGINAMIYVSDPATHEILFVNDTVRQQFDVEGDYVGQLCYKLYQKSNEGRCDFCPCNQLDKEPGKIVIWDEHIPSSNRMYHNTDRYIGWPNGKTVHIQHSVDVTELVAAKEFAERSSRYKSEFLATVSHEIRTPMNAILGITEIQLQNENLPQDTQEALAKIYDSGYLLLGIINDILDLSKIEVGKFEISPDNYDAASLINDTIYLNIMRFENKPIEFELQLDENIPSMLFGDELRIKQILNNLLSNAFKYTDSGKVLLSVTAEYEGQLDVPQVTIVFSVKDTGQGMTEEQVNKLFTEYTRFHTEANRKVEGTGLGLNITRNLVHMMNGEISVESEPRKGSKFTVWLPQGLVNSGVLGKELTENFRQLHFNKKIQLKKAQQIVREYMPYGKVLIVDDLETNLYVAKGLMSPYGLMIDTAKSGFEAIERIRSGAVYDLIFMDHFMPKMDGIEATKYIRELGYTQPIVALTANALTGQAEIFLANGFDGFISKPIDIRELNATLNKLIRDKYSADTVASAQKLNNGLKEPGNGPPLADPQLAKIFRRDAQNAVDALEAFYERLDIHDDNDIQNYIINVHAMKSALANIGENELSHLAAQLEQAGRERNIAEIADKTPVFLKLLRVTIGKLKPTENAGSDTISGEDQEFLRVKLIAIQSACTDYDITAVRGAMTELQKKTWPNRITEQLESIARCLLHSEFEEAAKLAKWGVGNGE
jgi:CheY-like chemotaxis protein/nitrogen-specific signal transduction histidine kinase/ABC-type amino acid transport substrate-binding protein